MHAAIRAICDLVHAISACYRSCHVFYDPICFHDWDKTPQNQSETLNARNFHANLTTGGHILIHDWKIRTLFESHENIFPCSCDFDQFWSESTERELQTNDGECWYACWVLHRDYRYMQNPLNFGAWTICQHLYSSRLVPFLLSPYYLFSNREYSATAVGS